MDLKKVGIFDECQVWSGLFLRLQENPRKRIKKSAKQLKMAAPAGTLPHGVVLPQKNCEKKKERRKRRYLGLNALLAV